jgi:hypothetical protein
MFIVVGAMGQRLPEQGSVMEAHAERALKLLEGVVSRRGL